MPKAKMTIQDGWWKLFLVLMTLKLTGHFQHSWWIVIIPLALNLMIMAFIALINYSQKSKLKDKVKVDIKFIDLALILLVLKITNVIDWSWFIILGAFSLETISSIVGLITLSKISRDKTKGFSLENKDLLNEYRHNEQKKRKEYEKMLIRKNPSLSIKEKNER